MQKRSEGIPRDADQMYTVMFSNEYFFNILSKLMISSLLQEVDNMYSCFSTAYTTTTV